jgi:hypothetical protein
MSSRSRLIMRGAVGEAVTTACSEELLGVRVSGKLPGGGRRLLVPGKAVRSCSQVPRSGGSPNAERPPQAGLGCNPGHRCPAVRASDQSRPFAVAVRILTLDRAGRTRDPPCQVDSVTGHLRCVVGLSRP